VRPGASGGTFQRVTRFCVVLVAVAAIALAPSAGAQPDTTRPGFIHQVRVLLRDNSMTLSQAHFLRGSEARFTIRNVGTHPASFRAGFLKTKVLKPGQTAILYMHLGLRGAFPVEQWRAGERVAAVVLHVQ
jgi:hypothetical protein